MSTKNKIIAIRHTVNKNGVHTYCIMPLTSIYYNEDEDEAKNTTETPLDNREEGDCDDESDCVLMLLSSYMFTDTESTYGDGEWTIAIHNEKVNDQKIESFVIILHYK